MKKILNLLLSTSLIGSWVIAKDPNYSDRSVAVGRGEVFAISENFSHSKAISDRRSGKDEKVVIIHDYKTLQRVLNDPQSSSLVIANNLGQTSIVPNEAVPIMQENNNIRMVNAYNLKNDDLYNLSQGVGDKVEHVLLTSPQMNTKTATEWSNTLSKSENIKHFTLENPNMSNEELEVIVDGISKNNNIKKVGVNRSDISYKIADKLLDHLLSSDSALDEVNFDNSKSLTVENKKELAQKANEFEPTPNKVKIKISFGGTSAGDVKNIWDLIKNLAVEIMF